MKHYTNSNGRVAGWMPQGYWKFFDSLDDYHIAYYEAMWEWLKEA